MAINDRITTTRSADFRMITIPVFKNDLCIQIYTFGGTAKRSPTSLERRTRFHPYTHGNFIHRIISQSFHIYRNGFESVLICQSFDKK